MARVRTRGAEAPKKPLDARGVAKALATNPKGIDSGMLLNTLIEKFGGTAKFAEEIHLEYEGSKPGSLTRQKILEMMTRLTVAVTGQELAKPKRSEDLTDEELQDQVSAALARMTKNGTAAAPAAEEEAGAAG